MHCPENCIGISGPRRRFGGPEHVALERSQNSRMSWASRQGGRGRFLSRARQCVGRVNLLDCCKITSENGPNPWGKTVANGIPRTKVVPTDSSTDYYPFASLQGMDTL
jgi:hypothetical protein